jgi:hypothetical protein
MQRQLAFLPVSSRLVLTVALVVGGGTFVSMPQPATASPRPSCVAEAVDEAAAQRVAATCGKSVEILAERTEVSQTWANIDGSQTVEIATEPVRVRKGSSWVPVNTRLKATADGIVPRASALPISFSAGGNGPLATLRDGSKKLAVSFPGALPKPELAGDTATYRDVYPGVDLKVTAQSVGFTEELVVRTREAARSPKLASLKFGLTTKGVKVAADATGALRANDGRGRAVFTSPAPFMWDSSVDGEASASAPEIPQRKVGASGVPKKDVVDRGAGKVRVRRVPMKVSVGKSDLTLVPDQALLSVLGLLRSAAHAGKSGVVAR